MTFVGANHSAPHTLFKLEGIIRTQRYLVRIDVVSNTAFEWQLYGVLAIAA